MKPIYDEQWTAESGDVFNEDGVRIFWSRDVDNEARTRLASAAPAMAKLLLAHEFADTKADRYGDQLACCRSCGEFRPFYEEDDREHRADCEWLRVARKAGLRP